MYKNEKINHKKVETCGIVGKPLKNVILGSKLFFVKPRRKEINEKENVALSDEEIFV